MKKKVTKEQRPLKVTLIIYFCSKMATFWNESKTVVGGHSGRPRDKDGFAAELPACQPTECMWRGGRKVTWEWR